MDSNYSFQLLLVKKKIISLQGGKYLGWAYLCSKQLCEYLHNPMRQHLICHITAIHNREVRVLLPQVAEVARSVILTICVVVSHQLLVVVHVPKHPEPIRKQVSRYCLAEAVHDSHVHNTLHHNIANDGRLDYLVVDKTSTLDL